MDTATAGPMMREDVQGALGAAFSAGMVGAHGASALPLHLGAAHAATIAQLAASPLAFATIAGPLAVADFAQAKVELLRSRSSAEQRLEQPRSSALPTARLIEVARAALQTVRRGQGVPLGAAPAAASEPTASERQREVVGGSQGWSLLLKREAPESDSEDRDRLSEAKRTRIDAPDAQTRFSLSASVPAAAASSADAVAHVSADSADTSVPVPVAELAESVPIATAAPAKLVSPFAAPPLPQLPGQSSVSGCDADGATTRATGAGSQAAPSLGGFKSAFAAAASAELWEPGCSFTTGRRSARSSALKSNGTASLPRALASEGQSLSRRGSGFVVAAAALAIGSDATGANAAAHGGLERSERGRSGTMGAWGSGGGSKPESAASADLRRLAQLAEAAALLEGFSAGHAHGNAADGADTGGKATTSPSRHRTGSLPTAGMVAASGAAASATGSGGSGSGGCGGSSGRQKAPPQHQQIAGNSSGAGAAHGGGGASLRSANSLPLRALESQPLPGSRSRSERAARDGSPDSADGCNGSAGLSRGRSGELDSWRGGARESGAHDDGTDADEGMEGDDMLADEDEDDSAGGDSSGRSLTDRYRAVLKASAQQRGRGSGSAGRGGGGRAGSPDDEDVLGRSGSMRNGVCARIASITKERLQQVYHLNIEEAARELGIGMTKLKEHCRTLGIPRWPSRKLKSMDKLIESLNERAAIEPATKEVINDILAEIESFKRAIYENPCLEVEEDIKRLRQSNFKKEYQQRQVEQRLRVSEPRSERERGGASSLGRAASGSLATSSQQQERPATGSGAVASRGARYGGNLESSPSLPLTEAGACGMGVPVGVAALALAAQAAEMPAVNLARAASLAAVAGLIQPVMPPSNVLDISVQSAAALAPPPPPQLPGLLPPQLHQLLLVQQHAALHSQGITALLPAGVLPMPLQAADKPQERAGDTNHCDAPAAAEPLSAADNLAERVSVAADRVGSEASPKVAVER